ncbi:MAG: hypothetical protein PVJ40_01780 [Gammaproteobacteria bacterium]|jgi:hypothetical protein
MLKIAVALFAVAALGGLAMAIMAFRNRPLPAALAGAHGLLAASGLVLVILAVIGGAGNPVTLALVILLVAALGGFYLLSHHLRGTAHPRPVIVIHGLAAAAGFLVLLGALLGGAG